MSNAGKRGTLKRPAAAQPLLLGSLCDAATDACPEPHVLSSARKVCTEPHVLLSGRKVGGALPRELARRVCALGLLPSLPAGDKAAGAGNNWMSGP